jgi:hypothetical protein
MCGYVDALMRCVQGSVMTLESTGNEVGSEGVHGTNGEMNGVNASLGQYDTCNNLQSLVTERVDLIIGEVCRMAATCDLLLPEFQAAAASSLWRVG